MIKTQNFNLGAKCVVKTTLPKATTCKELGTAFADTEMKKQISTFSKKLTGSINTNNMTKRNTVKCGTLPLPILVLTVLALLILVPGLTRSQSPLTAEGLAALTSTPTPPSGGGGFTYTLVGHKQANASGSGLATTALMDTTSANLYVVVVSWVSGTLTLTDSTSDSFTGLTVFADVSGTGWRTQIFYVINPTTSSSATFSVESTPAGYPSIQVLAFKKSSGTPAFDVESGLNGAGVSSTTWQIPSATPTSDNAVGVSSIIFGISSGNATAISGGYTISDARDSAAAAYVIQTTATASSPTWTLDTAETAVAGAQAFFK